MTEGTVVTLLLVALYFLPAIAADLRRHPSAFAIGLLNLLLGWTVLGWIIALVWAVAAQPRDRAPAR